MRPRGGLVGKNPAVTANAATGVFTQRDLESYRRDGVWPAGSITAPTDLANLVLWLDASDSSTLYDATSGGSTVGANGSVARWEDKSGGGRHFTQATSGVRPVRKTSVKNSKDAIEFTNDWIGGVYTYTISSIFVVWEHPTTVSGDSQPAIMGSRTSSSNKVANSTLAFVLTLPSASTAAVDPFPSSGTYRFNGSAAGANWTNFAAGLNVKTSPDRWQYTSATFTAVTGSKAIVLGADPFSTVRYMQNGHIAEVIAYSSALSASDVLAVESYLVSKWGL